MRTTSRTILVLLAAMLTVGCGSKTSPGPDANGNSAPDGNTNPNTDTSAKPAYELDPTKHAIPASSVAGRVAGTDVTPTVVLEGDYLVFRTTKPGGMEVEREVLLKLRSDANQPLPVGKRVVKQDTPSGPEVPEAMIIVPGKDIIGHPNGYAMTLELEPRKAGKLAGKIFLCLPDPEKTFLAGTFIAAAPRLPTEPPGIEDVPLINGKVTIANAAANATLMTGYAASPGGSASPIGIAGVELQLGGMEEGPRWTERDDDKPRATFLVIDDAKKPPRFEHSKLTSGRYLAFAAIKDGPAVWKWVDVGPRTTAATDLTIDASKVGGLEVTAPLGSLGKVQMAPADDATRPPLDTNLLELIALQLRLEQDIVNRKALFKNLGPGRYVVRDRASGQVRVVEIVAGKTLEHDFDAKPTPPPTDPAPEPKPKG
jgi:hypothetical protein